MCGITGYIINSLVQNNLITSMMQSVAHRGPDDGGLLLADVDRGKVFKFCSAKSPSVIKNSLPVLDKNCPTHDLAMAQVRYSIIDLSPNGHQPMWSQCGRYAITFNGEVYNYVELREELVREGVLFKSMSDTEVFLNGFIKWGEKIFEKINGFFAVAIYNHVEKTITLARDRLGKAHLYLAIKPGKSVFWASEIKALIVAGQISKDDVNPTAITEFVVKGRRDWNGTFWNNVTDFPPGSYSVIKNNCLVTTRRYWQLGEARWGRSQIGFTECANEFQRLLINSIELRMRSDVEVGFELSGGLDSSSLVALAAGVLGKRIKTYTIKFDERDCDEEPFARTLAQQYKENISYEVIRPKPDDFWQHADEFIWQQEEPFHAPNLYTAQSMQRLIKEHGSDVVISGAAGDEVLAGYPTEYYRPFVVSLIKELRIADACREIMCHSEFGPLTAIRGLLTHLVLSEDQRGYIHRRVSGESAVLVNTIFCGKNISESPFWSNLQRDNFDDVYLGNLTNRKMNYWLRSGMKASYGIPIETRIPFLDYRIVEFCSKIPAEYLICKGWHKYLLRKIVEPILSPEIVWRKKKMGFPFPYRRWLESEKRIILNNIRGVDCPYVDCSQVADRYDRINSVAPTVLWRIISTILWWRKVVVNHSINV
jgi:asparagine synthase (glutamine-hydrolysing)